MEEIVHSMARKRSYDSAPISSCYWLAMNRERGKQYEDTCPLLDSGRIGDSHGLSYISEKSTWFAYLDGSVQAFTSRTNELLRILIYFSYWIGLI